MDFLAQWLANPATIFAVVGLLVAWAGWSAAHLYRRTERLISALSGACAVVEKPEFLANFEATAKQFATLPMFAGAWSAYHDTLIVGDETASHPVRSTLRPDRVFDLGLLRGAGVRQRKAGDLKPC